MVFAWRALGVDIQSVLVLRTLPCPDASNERRLIAAWSSQGSRKPTPCELSSKPPCSAWLESSGIAPAPNRLPTILGSVNVPVPVPASSFFGGRLAAACVRQCGATLGCCVRFSGTFGGSGRSEAGH